MALTMRRLLIQNPDVAEEMVSFLNKNPEMADNQDLSVLFDQIVTTAHERGRELNGIPAKKIESFIAILPKTTAKSIPGNLSGAFMATYPQVEYSDLESLDRVTTAVAYGAGVMTGALEDLREFSDAIVVRKKAGVNPGYVRNWSA